jgi:trk system potassium uptake protein
VVKKIKEYVMAKNKFLVIGCGRFGGQIATEISAKGTEVIVLDQKEDAFRKLQDTFQGYKIIGDATQLDTLKKAYIQEASHVLISTNRDNVNILIAHICDQYFKVDNIYIRLLDTEKEQLITGDHMKPIYPYKLSIQSFYEQYKGEEL